MQHCWPKTPNIIACYMLRSFHTLLHVIVSCCAKFETSETCRYNVRSCCVRLHVALELKHHNIRSAHSTLNNI